MGVAHLAALQDRPIRAGGAGEAGGSPAVCPRGSWEPPGCQGWGEGPGPGWGAPSGGAAEQLCSFCVLSPCLSCLLSSSPLFFSLALFPSLFGFSSPFISPSLFSSPVSFCGLPPPSGLPAPSFVLRVLRSPAPAWASSFLLACWAATPRASGREVRTESGEAPSGSLPPLHLKSLINPCPHLKVRD